MLHEAQWEQNGQQKKKSSPPETIPHQQPKSFRSLLQMRAYHRKMSCERHDFNASRVDAQTKARQTTVSEYFDYRHFQVGGVDCALLAEHRVEPVWHSVTVTVNVCVSIRVLAIG